MKLDISVNLEDVWTDNDTLAGEIRDQIKYHIRDSVKKQINMALKDVLADQHKEIKEAARKYGKVVLKGILEGDIK